MKVLYSWLKEFVAMDLSPQETANVLSRLGFEIAELKIYGGALQGVITAEVLECGKHPNADRLSLCKVSTGKDVFQVVCGASNVHAGIKVAFAPVGATLPAGDSLKTAKIRGVESFGMICSADELGLDDKSDGILILPNDTPVGEDIRERLGLNDALIDIEVTPNRRDVLGVLGVARELAAGLGLPIRTPEPRMRELDLATNSLTLVNEETALCPRYIARYIKDVQVAPSPAWMTQRLTRCGIRSINNLVDITNYVMLELGQPLHVFDAAKLEGHQVRVRLAREGETLLTLEGKTNVLKPTTLVIADASRPAALAGIMGGQDSAISATTQSVVLESAAFAMSTVRKSSKQLGVRSESSYRFERGSDWDMVAFASRRAAQLIQELAGGLGFKPLESSAPSPAPIVVKMRSERMKQFLGADIKEAQAADILRRLGCIIGSGTAAMAVTIPSWRLDLRLEADLFEEIARLYSYEAIPIQPPSVHMGEVPEDPLWTLERDFASVLAGLGFYEALNYSYLSEAQCKAFGSGFGLPSDATPVAIANPLSLEQAILRPSLLPALFQNAALNFNRQVPGVRLFECGRIFYQTADGPQELRRVAFLLGGELRPAQWADKPTKADFFALSGLVDALMQRWHIPHAPLISLKHPAFHPKRSATLLTGRVVLGWLGELHPGLLAGLGIKEPVVAAELDLEAWRSSSSATPRYRRLPGLPATSRDLSIVVPEPVAYEKVIRTIRTAGGSLLESCGLIDLFTSDKIGTGKKSMTYALRFRHPERTLSDNEVEKLMSKILIELQNACQAVIRS